MRKLFNHHVHFLENIPGFPNTIFDESDRSRARINIIIINSSIIRTSVRQLSIYPLALGRFLLQCDLELSLTVYFCFSLELFDTADVLQVFIKKKTFQTK